MNEGLGLSEQEANISSVQTPFIEAIGTKRENAIIKGLCNKPLKPTCRILEEGDKEVILPSISTPTLRIPSNQVGKYCHKLAMSSLR